MKHSILPGFGILVVLSAPWSAPTWPARAHGPTAAPFAKLGLHLEVDLVPGERSVSDLPAELVLEVGSERGLTALRMSDASGRTLLEIGCPGPQGLRLSEISLECEGDTLRDLLREVGPGGYLVEATTVDGMHVEGVVELPRRFPGMFAVLSPLDGEVVPLEETTIAWTPSARAARYLLEIEHEESGFSLEVALAASQTSFTMPAQMLRPGTTYEYSLAVEGDTDNQLEIEGRFATPLENVGPRPAVR